MFSFFYVFVALYFFSLLLFQIFLLPRIRNFFSSRPREFLTIGDHAKKNRIPSSAGLLFFLAPVVLLFCHGITMETLFIFFSSIFSGLIGWWDDMYKRIHGKGISVKEKFFVHALLIFCAVIMRSFFDGSSTGSIWFGDFPLYLSIFYIPWVVFVIVSTTHAINLTDGIDGLAASQSIITLSGLYGVMFFARIENGVIEDAILFMIIILAAFLKFNWNPAKMFMGDTGALFLGGYISTLFILQRMELFLIISGGVFVLETLSVIIQYSSVKFFKYRLPIITPFHHTLEKWKIKEKKIVYLFAITGVICQWIFYGIYFATMKI